MNKKAAKIQFVPKSKGLILSLLLFSFLSISAFMVDKNELPSFVLSTQDSIEIKFYLFDNELDSPYFYMSHIKTPVCDDGLCYDIELIVFWNLIGDFTHFEVLPNKPLTKYNHEKFSENDYLKLTKLLSNPNPLLSNYKKHELTTKVQNVDGVSGATLSAIKEETIPGAVYTCYTLWHLINGEAKDTVKKYTAKLLNKEVITTIANYKNEDSDYFLIDNLTPEQFQLYLPQLLPLLVRNNWSFGKYFFDNAPDAAFSTSLFQDFLVVNYSKLGYFAQVSLLRKLQNKQISKELYNVLVQNSTENLLLSELTNKIGLFNSKTLIK